MRQLLHTSLAILLITFVMGCSRTATDRRLALADSLMWTAPDSSLAILNAINRDSLQGDENQAYHALLLTQAQYRNYIPLTTDTLITKAVDYYSDNHNREHYTRALLYKGGAYEDMNRPIDAMRYYKQAEENADTTDYRNLAQLNMRMGMLYYNNFASNNLDLEKFKNAFKYYEKLHDKQKIMSTLGYIGCLYRENNKAQAIRCLSKAKDMALDLSDTLSYYTILNNLSMAFFMDSSFVEAKETAVECINNSEITNAMLFNAANAYAALGMPDSARYYLNKVVLNDISDYDKMMIAFSKGHIFKASGNEKDALFYQNLGTAISDTIKANSNRDNILETENLMEAKLNSEHKKTIGRVEYITVLSIVIFFILVTLLCSNIIIKNKRHKSLIREFEHNQVVIEYLIKENKENICRLNTTKELNDSLKQQHREQTRINDYMNDYFNSFSSLLQKSKELSYADFVEEFNKTVAKVSKDKTFWDIIRIIADKKSNNLISKLENEHPSLSGNDLKVLCLICLGYKNDAIASSLELEKSTVKSLKTKIKNKIGASINLDAYIKLEIYNK